MKRKRLTTKVVYNYITPYNVENIDVLVHNKLGQLEDILEGHNIEKLEELDGLLWYIKRIKDIEEELGIDLITYFKLINAKNVYSYGHTSIMKNTGQVDIYDRTITIWNGSCHQTYPLSEYGKSFALTKEELESL